MRTRHLLAAVLLGVLLTPPGLGAVEQRRRPNIVLIMADDLGYAELGSYGQKKIRTPHLDRLARQGMRFTRNYAGNAVCAPSRCVLMTGKHPGHAYVRNNGEVRPEGQRPIPETEITIAELLKEERYATGAFGKWGLGFPGSEGDPLNQGFDRFFGYNCQRHAHSYYPSYLWSDDKRIPLDNKPPVPGHARLAKDADPADPASYEQFKGQDYAPDRINKQALAFIRQNRHRPFFLYYPTVIPHVALHVPDEELKPYLDLLKELGLENNTIVIFTSDNGTTHLKQEVDYDFFASVKPLRGLKGSLYEGGIRVPLIVRWPGQVKAGSVSDLVTGLEDWVPTLIDIVGARKPPPAGIDGVSIAPTLLGNKQPPRPFLYREFSGYGGQQAVWIGRWKGVRQRILRRNNPTPLKIELFDLESDLSESKDVAAAHTEIVTRIRTLMTREHQPSQAFPIKPLD